MSEMIKHHMVSNKTNTGLVGKKGDVYSRACVYWHQQQPFIKEFLNDPMVPPDTNIVEQAVRPITCLERMPIGRLQSHIWKIYVCFTVYP